MTDKFSRLASHFETYWNDKGVKAPKMNFNITAIEKEAEEKAKEDNSVDNLKSKSEPKHKEKELDISAQINDLDSTIEKAVENKIKTIIGRIIDDKIRNALSKNFTNFEQAVATKIESKVNDIKPRVLNDLKIVAPNVGKEDSSDKKPLNFTDSAFMDDKEDKDILTEKASCEVMPGIIVKASTNDKGEIYIKQNNQFTKMHYTVSLPQVSDVQEYRKQLRANIEALVK